MQLGSLDRTSITSKHDSEHQISESDNDNVWGIEKQHKQMGTGSGPFHMQFETDYNLTFAQLFSKVTVETLRFLLNRVLSRDQSPLDYNMR